MLGIARWCFESRLNGKLYHLQKSCLKPPTQIPWHNMSLLLWFVGSSDNQGAINHWIKFARKSDMCWWLSTGIKIAHESLHPRKPTWQWKIPHLKMRCISYWKWMDEKGGGVQCHISFQGCRRIIKRSQTWGSLGSNNSTPRSRSP